MEVFEIDEFVSDPATEFGFAKTSIKNARVGTFGASELVSVGDMVFVISGDRVFPRTVVEDVYYENETGVMSSDVLGRMFLLDQPTSVVSGGMVMNGAGELVGVMADGEIVRPLHHLTPALEEVLLTGEVDRPSMGISFIDVSRVLYSGDEFREGLKITKVTRESVADVAGLRVNDVILKVNGRSVNELPLAEYVVAGKVGTELQLSVMRGETEEEIFVTIR